MFILVVEDEAPIARELALVLSAAGYQVLGPAGSVEEALRLAEQTDPELALVNIDLRDRHDGIELVRILRARHGVPSLFLSTQDAQAHANKDAAWGLIRKPYDPQMVLSAVRVVGELMKSGQSRSSVPAALELF